MVRIFLKHGIFGYRIYRALSIFTSLIFFTGGFLFTYLVSNPSQLIGAAYFISGSIFMFKSIYLFLPKNAPRIELNENNILLRKALFEKNVIFAWSDINMITFSPYRIIFELNDNIKHEVNIETENPDISIKIKSFISSISSAKGVLVNG